MKDVNELLEKIEELREEMNNTINKNSNLQDSNIIEISRLLDEHLVEYYKSLKDKMKQYSDL
ncbi:MAG: hypothetical protein APF77_19685 [Clostridia bacterium BRH_c25]|nr:MAG: hypothetical protein APF77_19685 [Clostridia bacterium BRH_c25]